jgi:hypothetical protein
MTTATMPQSPAFVAAVYAYCEAYRAGERSMDALVPLIKRVEAAFTWQPHPKAKPLTKRQKASTLKTWHALDQAHEGQITEIALKLIDMPADERSRTIDMWMAVMDVMPADAPAGGA